MQFLIFKLRNQIYEKQTIRLPFFRRGFGAAFIVRADGAVIN
jgi:hypothetical protein